MALRMSHRHGGRLSEKFKKLIHLLGNSIEYERLSGKSESRTQMEGEAWSSHSRDIAIYHGTVLLLIAIARKAMHVR